MGRLKTESFAWTVAVCLIVSTQLCSSHAEGNVLEAGGNSSNSSNSSSAAGDAKVDQDKLLYQRLLKVKRKQQREVANSLLALDDFEKQYKVVVKLTTKVVQILTAANATLNQSNFVPSVSPFPTQNELELREALANVVENTVFFGDVALRLPDVIEEMLKMKKSKKWLPLIQWAWDFTNRTELVIGTDSQVLSLMAQELSFVPRNPNYENPFRKPRMTPQEWEKLRKEKARKEREEERKKKKKGRRKPRLGGGHTEL